MHRWNVSCPFPYRLDGDANVPEFRTLAAQAGDGMTRYSLLSEGKRMALTEWADVRGWEVRTMVDGAAAGKVRDVILDVNAVPRYLIVDPGALKSDLLLPIAHGRADPAEPVVWVPGMAAAQFAEVPVYPGTPELVTRSYEDVVGRAFSPLYTGERRYERQRPAARMARRRLVRRRPRRRPEAPERLAPLGELEGFRVAGGADDPRGWNLVTATGEQVGTVVELLVDTAQLRVRYLKCSLLEGDSGACLLVPARFAQLEPRARQVVVPALAPEDLERLPVCDGLPLPREVEERLHRIFAGRTDEPERGAGLASAEQFYRLRLAAGGDAAREGPSQRLAG
jgi:hypothetical protein